MRLFLTGNPIHQAEYRHQRSAYRRGQRGRWWSLLSLPIPLLSLLVTGVLVLDAFFPGLASLVPEPPMPFFGPLFVLLAAVGGMCYLIVTGFTLVQAANSIRREKAGRTWDSLRITGMDPRRIVWGKWWASLHVLGRQHLMVALLHAGWVALFAASVAPVLARTVTVQHNYLSALPLLLLLVLIYGALDAGLSAALGMVVALSEGVIRLLAALLVLVGRLLISVMALAWFAVTLLALVHAGIEAVVVLSALGTGLYSLILTLLLWTAQRIVG